MSSYFKAAEICGLRSNTEASKRLARRTVPSNAPSALVDETLTAAAAEADAVAASLGVRRPSADVCVLPEAELPFSSDRAAFHSSLVASEVDVKGREEKDWSELAQRQKVQRMEQEALEAALLEERLASEAEARKQAEMEAAHREAQHRARESLRATYGPNFLWDAESMKRIHRRVDFSTIEEDLERELQDSASVGRVALDGSNLLLK
jgi:hypothetical protein